MILTFYFDTNVFVIFIRNSKFLYYNSIFVMINILTNIIYDGRLHIMI